MRQETKDKVHERVLRVKKQKKKSKEIFILSVLNECSTLPAKGRKFLQQLIESSTRFAISLISNIMSESSIELMSTRFRTDLVVSR